MNSSGGDGLFGRRIAPFGNPRIKACLPLPGAYRSLPRPSSPCDAKASTVRPFALVRFFKPFRSDPRSVALAGHLPRSEAFASILTEVAASRPPRSGSQLFASKPRARFDCLEIELLMSSHLNFSRLPLSKSRKSAWNRFSFSIQHCAFSIAREARELVGVTGVEPVTFTLSV